MADYDRRDDEDDSEYRIRFREDEEMEFFTELALHETERWIQAVTKQSFKYRDDTRKSLENGVLLCELLNGLRPGTIKRINRLPTPLAGLDNINVFLKACKSTFGLTDVHLFNPSDLEDLSQRAIAESDHLKEEYDKRLRNVAITIYWLGQQAASQPHVYQGPQLDLTAFSALVNRKHHDLVHRSDWEAAGAAVTSQQRHNYGYGGGSNSSNSRHTRDSSLDGYEKAESVNSLDDNSFEMPMNRYNSASALYSSNANTTTTSNNNNNSHITSRISKMPNNNDSIFDGNASNIYRSSPDLVNAPGSSSHRRYSSTDSMDGSSHYSGHSGQSGGHSGSHSRQGSVSDEVSYPTRRLSTTIPRRQSTSADPLQFIKSKGAQDLAQIAQVQMKVAAESKKEATITRTRDDDIDWQANLSTWKNRRKSQSERSYQLREELEQMEREKEDGSSGPTLPAKTYSQMQEERERRKSTGRKFYPIEDEEEEEDIYKPTSVGRLESSLPSSRDKQAKEDEGQESEEDQNDGNNNKNNIHESRFNQDSSRNTRQLNSNRDWASNSKAPASEESSTSTSALLSERRASRSRLSEKLRSFDEDAEQSGWSGRGQGDDRQRRTGAPEYNKPSSIMDNGVSHSASEDSGTTKESTPEDNSDNSRLDSASVRRNREDLSSDSSSNLSSSMAPASRSYNATATNSVKLTTRNVGSRTQSKIGSIMRNFEEAESKRTAPKQGYNEKIDIGARKSAFEATAPQEDTALMSRSSADALSSSSRRLPHSSYPVGDSPMDEEGSCSGSEDDDDDDVDGDDADEDSAGADASTEPGQKVPAYYTRTQNADSSNSADAKTRIESVAQSQPSAEETLRFKDQDLGKGYVEKTVKISQAKNSDRGFGFFLTGGADADSPLAVSKVALGSSADVCDLRLKDQVLAVNQQDVTAMTATQVGDIVARAVTTGFIELHVRREKGEDDLEDEEDFSSSSDEGDEDIASPGYKGTQDVETSVMDQLAAERQWLEQQIEQGEKTSEEKGDNLSDSQDQEEAGEIQQTIHTPSLTRPKDQGEEQNFPSSKGSKIDPGDASGGDDGPPAVLRKWQRQRQKEEYTFDSPQSRDITETFRKISLNTAPPRSNDREKELSRSESPERGTAKAWDHRNEQWTREQDARRQHGMEEEPSNATKTEFEENQAKMRADYEEDMRRAEEKEIARKRQETEMLQPELDKAQLLEERRAERRARIFNTAAAATSASPPPPPAPPSSSSLPTSSDQQLIAHRQYLYGDQFEREPEPSVQPDSSQQSSTMVFHVKPLQLQQQQPKEFKPTTAPSQQDGVFVIDPRNKHEPSSYSAKPVAFHVNLGLPAADTSGDNSATLLEAERERIRLEELRKIEEERKRAEEEIKAKEEEEMRKIKEKEEELRKEKELLRLERERFLKEQEEFKRFKEQQQKQQLQQQQQQQQLSQLDVAKTSSYPSQQANSNYSNSFNNNHNDRNITPRSNTTSSNSLPKWPPVNTNYSTNAPVTKSNNNSSRSNSSSPVTRARGFSREEMLSPSKPQAQVPASQRERRERNSPARDHYNHRQQPVQHQNQQYNQQQPQNQQHNPYQRQQNTNTSSERGKSPTSNKRNSPFPGLGDHWLVEEAERRRLAESEGRLHSPNSQSSMLLTSGPIRPHAELPNRWRGDSGASSSMPDAIRQTLLQKTATARGDSSPNNSDLPPPPPPHDPYRLSPASRSPSHSPARSPSGYRSVSPPGRRSPNYSYHPTNHHQQQQPQHPQQQQQYRQQIHHHPQQQQQQPNYQQPQNYSLPSQNYIQHQSPAPYRSPYSQDQPGKPSYSVPPHHVPPPPPMAPVHAPPPPGGENGLPVSGTQLCSYCNQELGFGAAMVIESLGLFYHVNCFRCCVCHTSLGTGSQGADVRVRANQLHCPDCYSNDEAGLKFSKV